MGISLLDERSLRGFGESLGQSLSVPAVFALTGDLGAGKTTLVQAIARGMGVPDPVTSPTFALVHRYAPGTAGLPLIHLDLYRLAGPHELESIGFDELVSERAVVVVEWPERAGALLPRDVRWLRLSHVDGRPEVRALEVAA